MHVCQLVNMIIILIATYGCKLGGGLWRVTISQQRGTGKSGFPRVYRLFILSVVLPEIDIYDVSYDNTSIS